jgi:catechol 2,3-dioxygenase-like lactoylglutathione lyase family enzyme
MKGRTKGRVRLDHCVIASTDLDRTNAFYAQVFGAEIESPMPDFRQYRIGDQMLNVHGPGLAAVAPAELLAKVPVGPGGSDLCFEGRGSMLELEDHLQACSVVPTVGPIARAGARGDGISLYFRDPDGSLLEFIVYEDS